MRRLVLTEGKPYSKTIPTLAGELGIDDYSLMSALYATDAHLSERLSIKSALHIERERFSFNRIAGVFPVTEQLEIEVMPKFLNGDEAWRSDFLLLLARTRWGTIVERQMVSTSKSRERGINDSLALVFLTMLDRVAHVPIRTYRRKLLQEFAIEGDLDEESAFAPDKDGFIQEVTEFTRRNSYNAIISKAARILLSSVSDFDLKARLERSVCLLGPQDEMPTTGPRDIPSRFRNWSDLYALSVDILDGYGIDHTNQGDFLSPGFVVRTSNAWEEFIRQALVTGMNGCSVAFQEQYPFAKRDESIVKVKPDYTLRGNDGSALLVDAKYKYGDASNGAISNADIYEGWAFMEAAGISRLVLLYPYSGDMTDGPFEQFQRVFSDNREIIGTRVNPELVGHEGMLHFATELAKYVRPLMLT